MKRALDANMMKLRQKDFVINFIKGFWKVEKDSVSLACKIEAMGEVSKSGKKLRFTASALAKAVLKGSKDIVWVKEVHGGAVYNMF